MLSQRLAAELQLQPQAPYLTPTWRQGLLAMLLSDLERTV